MPNLDDRFIADYVRDETPFFRCFIDFGREGWAVPIFDLRQKDSNTGKALIAFNGLIDTPENGKTKAELRLAWLLGRNDLPLQSLDWRFVEREN